MAFQFIDFVTKYGQMSTMDIVELTGCKENCISYKYEVKKIQEWVVDTGGVNGKNSLKLICCKYNISYFSFECTMD